MSNQGRGENGLSPRILMFGFCLSTYMFEFPGRNPGSVSGSPGSNGCRTLANLSKLSRRLGLSRFFRTLRIHGHGHHHATETQRKRGNGIMPKPREQKVTLGHSPGSGLSSSSNGKVGHS